MKVIATVHLTADDLAIAISNHIQNELGASADVTVEAVEAIGQDLYAVSIGNVSYDKPKTTKARTTGETVVKRRRRTKAEIEAAQAQQTNEAELQPEEAVVAHEEPQDEVEEAPEVVESDVPALVNPYASTPEDQLYADDEQPTGSDSDFM